MEYVQPHSEGTGYQFIIVTIENERVHLKLCIKYGCLHDINCES
jgi:hypothetical protein